MPATGFFRNESRTSSTRSLNRPKRIRCHPAGVGARGAGGRYDDEILTSEEILTSTDRFLERPMPEFANRFSLANKRALITGG